MGGRRGAPRGLFASVVALSLVRWSLLKGLPPPGVDGLVYIHVVCRNNCGNQWWETAYSPHTVTPCYCEGEYIPMVRCKGCPVEPGHHLPPQEWQQEGWQ